MSGRIAMFQNVVALEQYRSIKDFQWTLLAPVGDSPAASGFREPCSSNSAKNPDKGGSSEVHDR